MRKTLDRFRSWVRSTDLIVLLAALTVVLGVWAFFAIADEVFEGETHHFDNRLLQSLRRPDNPEQPIGPWWLKEVAQDLTALGGFTVLTLMTAAIVGYLLICRAYGAVCFVLAATLGGLFLSTLLKHSYDRPRPEVVPHLAMVYTSSFPSGHSMLSAVVYLSLGTLLARLVRQRARKIYFIVVAGLLTGLVGCSRVYLGVHYPTDVLAGWSAGLVWACLCWLAARYLQKRGAVERNAE